jgi:ubiquinone/menaquinone biosynthesis C-methylase UbiE
MDVAEGRMWWYAGLHANLIAALRHRVPSRSAGALLDAGCGTGLLLWKLGKAFPHLPVVGLDADAGACLFAANKSLHSVCVGSVNSLPFGDGSFTAIVSADVLCHRSVDEHLALVEFHRCLAPQGLLVLNLPAYQWMYSRHDRAVHTARRYTRSRLHTLLRGAGLSDIQTTYWNTVLFPLMALWRKLPVGGKSDVREYPNIIEHGFRAVMALENVILNRGITLPCGGSVLATAIKPQK